MKQIKSFQATWKTRKHGRKGNSGGVERVLTFPTDVFLVALWVPGQQGLESEGGAPTLLSAQYLLSSLQFLTDRLLTAESLKGNSDFCAAALGENAYIQMRSYNFLSFEISKPPLTSYETLGQLLNLYET